MKKENKSGKKETEEETKEEQRRNMMKVNMTSTFFNIVSGNVILFHIQPLISQLFPARYVAIIICFYINLVVDIQ